MIIRALIEGRIFFAFQYTVSIWCTLLKEGYLREGGWTTTRVFVDFRTPPNQPTPDRLYCLDVCATRRLRGELGRRRGESSAMHSCRGRTGTAWRSSWRMAPRPEMDRNREGGAADTSVRGNTFGFRVLGSGGDQVLGKYLRFLGGRGSLVVMGLKSFILPTGLLRLIQNRIHVCANPQPCVRINASKPFPAEVTGSGGGCGRFGSGNRSFLVWEMRGVQPKPLPWRVVIRRARRRPSQPSSSQPHCHTIHLSGSLTVFHSCTSVRETRNSSKKGSHDPFHEIPAKFILGCDTELIHHLQPHGAPCHCSYLQFKRKEHNSPSQ